jgi:hypothetical protein
MSDNPFSPSPSSLLQTLRWQFELTWKLASQYHLPFLTDDVCLWEPASNSWTVRRLPNGRWRPDWVEPEPDPPPTTSIGWLTWLLIWWWSGLLAVVRKEMPVSRDEMDWPGSAGAAVQRLESLALDWEKFLSELDEGDLDMPVAYPWQEPRPLRIALAWVNIELMKNIAEIGCIRHLFEAYRKYP